MENEKMAEANSQDCLLTYTVATNPVPLQVGNTGTITITISNPNKVYCNEIDLAISYGDGNEDLFKERPNANINDPNWHINNPLLATEEKVSDSNQTDSNLYTCSIDCKSSIFYHFQNNIVVTITGLVNDVCGGAVIQMVENSSHNTTDFNPVNFNIPIVKAPPVFYVSNFIATTTDNPTVPCSEFSVGEDICLSWESNGTFYKVYQKNETTPVYSDSMTTCTIKGGAKTDTTFILVASMNESKTVVMSSYIYDSLTISISNPELTPSSVSVDSTLEVKGGATLKGGTKVESDLEVDGASALRGRTTTGDLEVDGTSTLKGDTTIGGSLDVQQKVTTKNIEVNGTVSGNLDVTKAQISLLTEPQEISLDANGSASHTANTDGFVICFIDKFPSCGSGYIQSDGIKVGCSGGSSVPSIGLLPQGTPFTGNPGSASSCLLPVAAGKEFSVYAELHGGANIHFYWRPFGSGSLG